MRYENINQKDAIEIYKEYGSMNKAAMKIGCCAKTLRRILVENDISINKPKSNRLGAK
ncbi:hypothetical protein [Clostridium peptidivorans]|uniref:hypothetical protein n=1 Tax=Clostridium peptidivorans TaxID=100174 RepID=UPI0015CBA25A|nr:hypothetical protein [Clostridium peptidivorans]